MSFELTRAEMTVQIPTRKLLSFSLLFTQMTMATFTWMETIDIRL